MADIDLTSYLHHARTIAQQASDYLLQDFGDKIPFHEKEPGHFSIVQDKHANDLYETYLRQHTPEVSLYTEEGERNLDSELVWIVDPIDGTSNYSVGLNYWVTQIALMYKQQIVVGVIIDCVNNTTYHAINGQGAYQDDTKIHVSNTSDLNKTFISTEKSSSAREKYANYITNIISHVKSNRSPGATGLDLAHTAAGRFDAYIGLGSHLYDYAPGILLVQEAGGTVLNSNGTAWTPPDTELVASNTHLTKQLLSFM